MSRVAYDDLNYDVIVSLTANKVTIMKAINCAAQLLAYQKTNARYKVVLHLSMQDFPNRLRDTHITLAQLEVAYKNFEIEFVDNMDNRYNRYMPAMKEYPKHPIIALCEENDYDSDLVEKLYNKYKADSTRIFAITGKRFVGIDYKHRLFKFSREIWKNKPSIFNVPSTNNGVIYPPSCYKDELFYNSEIYMGLLPRHQDVWTFLWDVLLEKEVVLLTSSADLPDHCMEWNVPENCHGPYVGPLKNNDNDAGGELTGLEDDFDPIAAMQEHCRYTCCCHHHYHLPIFPCSPLNLNPVTGDNYKSCWLCSPDMRETKEQHDNLFMFRPHCHPKPPVKPSKKKKKSDKDMSIYFNVFYGNLFVKFPGLDNELTSSERDNIKYDITKLDLTGYSDTDTSNLVNTAIVILSGNEYQLTEHVLKSIKCAGYNLEDLHIYMMDNSVDGYELNKELAIKYGIHPQIRTEIKTHKEVDWHDNMVTIETVGEEVQIEPTETDRYIDNVDNKLGLVYGEDKVSAYIQYLFENISEKYMLVLYPDTYVKKNFTQLLNAFVDKEYLSVGYIDPKMKDFTRLHPCYELFNLEQVRTEFLHYDDENKQPRPAGVNFYKKYSDRLACIGDTYYGVGNEFLAFDSDFVIYYNLPNWSLIAPTKFDPDARRVWRNNELIMYEILNQKQLYTQTLYEILYNVRLH